jgi:DNA invertase Pin-like site-specific DNA recombinase
MVVKARRLVVSYIRFSSGEQALGDSERRQLDMARAWCERKGFELDESLRYTDRGLSGYDGTHRKRGALGRFLLACEEGRVPRGTILLVENLDRLGREGPANTLREIIFKLWDHGVTVVTLSPEEDYPPECANEPKFVVLILYLQRAWDESRRKSERVAANWSAWRAKVARGEVAPFPGKLPAWVSWTGTEFLLNEAAAASVRLVYRWAAEGLGVRRIVKRLNGRAVADDAVADRVRRLYGERRKARKSGDHELEELLTHAVARLREDARRLRRSAGSVETAVPTVGRAKHWRFATVADLLSDRRVLGELRVVVPGEEGELTYPGFYPSLVSKDDWRRARAALKSRLVPRKEGESNHRGGREGPDVPNLFSGLMRDARDGCPFHMRNHGRRYYVSAGAQRRQAGSVPAMIPVTVLENAFLRFVYELKPADLLGGNRGRDEERLSILDGKVAELESDIALYRGKAADRANKARHHYMEMLESTQGELDAAKAEREELLAKLSTNETASLHEAQRLLDALKGASDRERSDLRRRLKARVRELVESAWVFVWDVDNATKAAEVQVLLRGGNVRLLVFAWTHAGAYPGLSVGFGFQVGAAGDDDHLSGKLLSEYRNDGAVRDFFAAHQERARGAVLEAVRAELTARKALLESDRHFKEDSLGAYLAERTLDGLRFPNRDPRVRKAKA